MQNENLNNPKLTHTEGQMVPADIQKHATALKSYDATKALTGIQLTWKQWIFITNLSAHKKKQQKKTT